MREHELCFIRTLRDKRTMLLVEVILFLNCANTRIWSFHFVCTCYFSFDILMDWTMDLVEHLKWVRKRNFFDEKSSANSFLFTMKIFYFLWRRLLLIYKFFYIEGWNSWNHFHCGINEKIVQQTADALVATGLAAAGYQYGKYFSLLRIYESFFFYHDQ